jgi:cytoskeletal protein RodZ
MSYILDALKKSEAERRAQSQSIESKPWIHCVPDLNQPKRVEKKWRLYFVVLVVTVGFIGLSLILWRVLSDKTTVPAAVSAKPSTSFLKTADELPILASNDQTPSDIQLPNSTQSNAQIEATNYVNPQMAMSEKMTIQAEIEEAATMLEDNPTTANQDENLWLTTSEVSQNEGQADSIELSGVTYSDNPSRRSAIINGKFMYQGDTQWDAKLGTLDIVLIHPEGVILDVRGKRTKVRF